MLIEDFLNICYRNMGYTCKNIKFNFKMDDIF